MIDAEPTLLHTVERDADGELRARYEANRVDGKGNRAVEVVFPFGLAGFPNDAASDEEGNIRAEEACLALRIRLGRHELVIPLGDPRALDKLPAHGQGSGILYDTGGCCLVLDPVAKVAKVVLPTGYRIELGGDTDAMALASKVNGRLSALEAAYNVHTHPVATSGSATSQSGTASATPNTYTGPDVSSTDVKAKA